jgi:hypothetical protein
MQTEVLPSLPGYQLVRLSFVLGEVFDISVPRTFSLETTRSYMAHVEGEVECRRTQHALVDVKRPGDTTGTAPGFKTKLGPLGGRLTYKVLTPTYAYLCLTRKDGQPIKVQDIRPMQSVAYVVPLGKVALQVLPNVALLQEGALLVPSVADSLLLEITL